MKRLIDLVAMVAVAVVGAWLGLVLIVGAAACENLRSIRESKVVR